MGQVLTRTVKFDDDGTGLDGLLAFDPEAGKRPAVIVFHTWAGRGPNEDKAAERLAGLGYAGFAADLYGKGVRGSGPEENERLMRPFMDDRSLLAARMGSILEQVRLLPEVDPRKIAAIGFCFGGLCALDLARSGAELAGVAAFHALLAPPPETKPIRAKVAAFHGWDDPMAPPEELIALGRELSKAGADWQVHAYGGTMHGFTNPAANAPDAGILYDPSAALRAWRSCEDFLEEVFG